MPDRPTNLAADEMAKSPESVAVEDQSENPVRSKLLLKIKPGGNVGVELAIGMAVEVRVGVAVGEAVRVAVRVKVLVGNGVRVAVAVGVRDIVPIGV